MIEIAYELTFAERIEGPLGPTTGVPPRVCWQIAEASLSGPRIAATLAMPGTDWIRLDANGIRRQDQRSQFRTDDGALILMRYDVALIRADERFTQALQAGQPTGYGDQYMCMAPQFEVGDDRYRWLTESLFIAHGRLAGPRRIEYRVYRVV